MTRNLKMLGLAICVVMALSAVEAPVSQAALFHKPAGEEVRLTATPDGTGTTAHQQLDVAGASITCPTVSGEALISVAENTPETVTAQNIIYPAAGSMPCKFIGQDATVSMNGCDYKYTAAAPGTPGVNAAVSVACPAGNVIHFVAPNPLCTVTVPAQSLSGVTYHNNAAKSEITVEVHVTGIAYTAIGPGCPEIGTKTNGNYTTGNVIATGESTVGNMRSVFVE